MTTPPKAETAALMGALVADAATLGLHWIYDPDRIAKVGGARPAFTAINAANYEGVPAYFAHAARRDGDLSQYGEVLALAMRSVQDRRAFDASAYQTAYAAHFGAGGRYVGYIDRPTGGTLANIAAGHLEPSGVDDDQLPALAALPAIVARYHGTAEFHSTVESALRVTHVNEAASHYGRLFADVLADVLCGTALKTALATAARQEPLLQAALDSSEMDSTAYGEITGRACHLHQGMPLAFHILARSDSYRAAVTANILAGGDNCGRAIVIGSLAGAAFGLDDIPLNWSLSLTSAQDHFQLSEKISNSLE